MAWTCTAKPPFGEGRTVALPVCRWMYRSPVSPSAPLSVVIGFGSLRAAEASLTRMSRVRALALIEEKRRNAVILERIEADASVRAIVLTGAALMREREHGTVEHLLVMPVTPFEIMAGKVWAMALVVLIASASSLNLMVRGLLAVPIEGSLVLFFAGTCVHLFATTSMGILLATIARSMPQFVLLLFMVLLPMQILSGAGGIIRAQALSAGGVRAREGMSSFIDVVMQAAPTTHFVEFSQAILFRGAGLDAVWQQLASLAVIGTALFVVSLARFRKTLGTMT